MERTRASRDLVREFSWEIRSQQPGGPLDGEVRATTGTEKAEAPASLEQHIRRTHTQRRETLYGTIKEIDEDRPECDPETSYMDMQPFWREQNYNQWPKIEAHMCREDKEQTESPWLNENDSSGGQCLYLCVEKEKDGSNVRNPVRRVPSEKDLMSVIEMSPKDALNSRLEWSMHLLAFSDYNGSRSKSASPPPHIRSLLLEHWKTPKVLFDAHDHLWSGAMTYSLGSSWNGYLVQSDRSWGWACTLAISHNAISNITYGVCIGLEDREIQDLMFYLQKEGSHAANPLFIPIAFTQFYLRSTMIMNRIHNDDFFNIQYSMKTDYYLKPPSLVPELDLVEFTRKLTALSTSSVGVTQLCTTQDRIIQFLFEQLDLSRNALSAPNAVLATLSDRLSFTREILRAERQHNEYIKAASQAQVQMVYSLTAQKDNQNNLKLAQLSQKQNDINIKISKLAAYENRLSTRVAKESLRSSADMQVIAAVTLGFLPGTFVATLFSTSFWNFEPANKDSIVSKWVWLYTVVTIALTLAFLVAWRMVSRQKRNSIGKLERDLGQVLAIDNLREFDVEKVDEEQIVGTQSTPNVAGDSKSGRRSSHKR